MSHKYFVATPVDRSMLFNWASLNELKLIGQPVSLPSCESAWELDTQYNEQIHLSVNHLIGRGRMKLMNGEESIGLVGFDRILTDRTGVSHAIVSPFYY